MAEDLQRIRRFVRSLVWRERLVIGLGIAARMLLVLTALWVLLVLGAALRWDRAAAGGGLVALVGVGLWAAVVVPLVLRWRPSGDALRQAHHAEAIEPALRGRLLTAVERVSGPVGQESPELLGLVARRAVGILGGIRPGRVHSAKRAAFGLAAVAWIALMSLPLPLLAPGGATGVLRWWAAGFEAQAAAAILDFGEDEDLARVGDLVLHYTYPGYTGLEPRTVSNSTGDVRGPPGTFVRVTARSADPVEAAGLVAYEQRFEAEVNADREVKGSFTIAAEDGAYHLVTWRGGESQRSRDFQIQVEADLAPEVMLDAEDDIIEIALDGEIAIGWRARDDYGVQRVVLEIGGQEAPGSALQRSLERKAEVFDTVFKRPIDLGLKPGDEVDLQIAAWDNDTYSGSKKGVSRSVKLVVLGARGLDERQAERMDEILEAMIGVLADGLEEPWPPGPFAGDIAAWGEDVSSRYQPLQDLVDELWDRLDPESLSATSLERAVRTGGELVRYTQVAFSPGSTEAPREEDFAEVNKLRDSAIVALEDGILALDRALKLRALREVTEVAERMEEVAEELEQMLQQDEVDPLEMLAKLEHLEDLMRQLAEAASKLDDGGLKEFTNQRSQEMQDLASEIRKAIAEGNMEEAKKLMERLANQIQQMSEGVKDTLDKAKQESDDTMERAQELKEELQEIEEEQRKLQSEVQALREQANKEESDEAKKLWEEIRQESQQLVMDEAAYRDELSEAKREFNEVQRSEHGIEEARELLESANSEDVRGARQNHRRAMYGVDGMYRGFQSAKKRKGSLEGPGKSSIDAMYARLDRIEELLEKLEKQGQGQGSGGSPQTQQQSGELQQQQQQLEQRLEQAQEQADELSKDMPVQPEGMKEKLDQAGERMGEASEDLGQGKPMPAEGSQGAAAERVREARESLDKAMKQAQQQQQQMQGGQKPSGEQKQGSDESGDNNRNNPRPQVEIPKAEEFRTPEEYRKALLEGMEGDVPEEYRALKKRYYEELVRQ